MEMSSEMFDAAFFLPYSVKNIIQENQIHAHKTS